MRSGTLWFFDPLRTLRGRSLFLVAGFLFLDLWRAPVTCAQDRNNNAANASDLALQSLRRVTASASKNKAVLILVQNSAVSTAAHHEVNIPAALAYAPAEDLLLHHGDSLTVRQLSGWNEPGASITIRGEVAHSGSCGIRPGERISPVLAQAGGLQATAYPGGIVFEREEVRQLERKNGDELIERIPMETAATTALLATR